MIGTTGLHNLRIDCIVGIYPHEREQTQTVFLDVELDYDFGQAAAVDADCVLQAVRTPTRYVGLLGSRKPAEIALSVMYEYSEVLR